MANVIDRWHLSRPPKGARECAEHPGKVPAAGHGVGERWQVRWRDDGDRQRKRNFAKKAPADALAASLTANAHAGVYRDPSAGRQTFKAYAEEWLRTRPLAPSSRRAMQSRLTNHVYPVLGDMQLRKIKPSTVAAWITGMKGAAKTRRTIYEHVVAILNAAIDDDVITRNPCAARSVAAPKLDAREVQPWTSEQVRTARAALPKRWRVLVEIMAGLGVRQGEALGLAVSDVDFLRGHVDITRQLVCVGGKFYAAPPKGGKARRVPLRPAVRDALAAHLAEFRAVEVTLPWGTLDADERVTVELIVSTEKQRPVRYDTFNALAWWPAVAAAGLPHVRANGCHALRHTFASVLLAGGVPITEVQAYLGHASPAITWRSYAHFVPPVETTQGRVVRGLAAIDDLLLGSASSARIVPSEGTSGASAQVSAPLG